MTKYRIQHTKQAEEDIQTILAEFCKAIKGENRDYRTKALIVLLRSIELREILASAGYSEEDRILETASRLDIIAPNLRMLRTKFGHCIFFQQENHVLTVIRIIDGRAAYMVQCGKFFSLNVPDNGTK